MRNPLSPDERAAINAELEAVVQPLSRAHYEVDFDWNYVEHMLEGYARDYGLNLAPDFQRGHVWTPPQQSHFIENCMRGVVASSGLVIQFSAPHWDDHAYRGELPRELQIVDGLQRLTAVREFIAGRVTAFGRLAHAFRHSSFDPYRPMYRLRVAIHTFQTRAALLQHYLALNAGGTPHSDAEIARVRALLAAA